MACKAAVVAIMAGAGLAVTATPALAMPNDDACAESYAAIDDFQWLMEHATTEYEFWVYFRAWQTTLDYISLYC
jgi:hypothetical protein